MRKALFTLMLLLATAFGTTTVLHSTSIQHDISLPQTEKVVLCMGQYATKYHSTDRCAGLNNCKAEIKWVSYSDALRIGRSACKRCY